jgi:hypothetical protein
VSEGERADCTVDGAAAERVHAITPDEESNAAEDGKPSQQSKTASETKPAKRVKSKTARSRRLPSFLRRVDLFLSHRR